LIEKNEKKEDFDSFFQRQGFAEKRKKKKKKKIWRV